MPFQNVNGVDLYYEVAGQGGDPVLLLHGLGSSARDWEAQIAALSARYQVIAADMRGHGQSGKPPGPYSVPGFAADVTALMKSLSLESAHVVGISMGGMIGLQLAVDYPGMVRSLVTINGDAELVPRTPGDHLQIWLRRAILAILGMAGTGRFLSCRLFPRTDQVELRRVFVERWIENDPRAYSEAMRALLGWSVTDRLAEVKCPVLVIASDHDYTPLERKHRWLDRISGARLRVIDDARHAVTAEKPDEVNRVLLEFLSSV